MLIQIETIVEGVVLYLFLGKRVVMFPQVELVFVVGEEERRRMETISECLSVSAGLVDFNSCRESLGESFKLQVPTPLTGVLDLQKY